MHNVKNDVNVSMILRKLLNLEYLLPENGQYIDIDFFQYIKSVFEVPGLVGAFLTSYDAARRQQRQFM